MTPAAGIRKIEPQFRYKLWGSWNTEPWFICVPQPSAEPLGEVWFPAGDLLIKFLFTSQDLSVQVHPDDDYARRHENSRGKTEMWYILRAEPGARIALGFRQPIGLDRLAEVAQTGEIMELLNWIEVHTGEAYLIPAGTVHAVGAGIALCEIQQNSDVTYRLFDYGRPRELHLPAAIDVSRTDPHPGVSLPGQPLDGAQLLVECPYFATYRATSRTGAPVGEELHTRLLVVCEGTGQVNGLRACPGDVFLKVKNAGAGVPDQWNLEPEVDTPSGSMGVLLIR
jgi:mannose-6-phosphate isomerase